MRVLVVCALVACAAAVDRAHLRIDTLAEPNPLDAKEPQVDKKSQCGGHKLCATCSRDSDCVWCADNGGSCMPGNEKGPTEAGSCKNFEVDYCVNEPCSHYSNCHTCTMDPFCGFCHGSGADGKICVEGDKNGPLTGTCSQSAWDHGSKSKATMCTRSDYFTERVLGATGIGGTDESAAAVAIADMEKVANQMRANQKNAAATENQLLGGEKKSFGLVGHIKHLIQMWRQRKKKIKQAADLDRGFFEAKLKELQGQRRKRLVALQAIEKEISQDIKNDQLLVSRRNDQEAKLNAASADDDNALKAGEGADMGEFAHQDWGNGLGAHLAKGDKSFAALEAYLARMSAKHKHLLSNLNRKAHKALEKEMHASSVRQMAKQEAAWYACAYLKLNPDAKCFEFHDKYSGTEKARELSAEEDTRVCNQVKTILDAMKDQPTFEMPADKSEFTQSQIRKDVHLGWCINNLKVPQKFKAVDTAM